MSGVSIKGDVLSVTLMGVKFTIFLVVLLIFCTFMGYLCFNAIVGGMYSGMPRSFFAGIGGASIIFGGYFLYTVFDHRTRVVIHMKKRAFVEYRRFFGKQKKQSYSLGEGLVVSKMVTQKYTNNANGIGYRHRAVYDIDLIDGKKSIPIYAGFDLGTADSIMDFFSKHNVLVVTPTPKLNKWVAIFTVLFMSVLLFELYTMGLLDG